MPTIVNKTIPFRPYTGAMLIMAGKQYAGILSLELESCGADRYLSILLYLEYSKQPVKQQVLVDNLYIDKASMVRMVDYLVEKELVRRVKNPLNRREHLLELSQEGRKKIPRIHKAIEEVEEKLFKGVTKNAKKEFLKVLQQLSENALVVPAKPIGLQFKIKSKT